MGVVLPLDEGLKKSRGASVEPLTRLTAEGMARVNALIAARAGSDVELIPDVARHLIDSGGKRLRPMLTLAAAEMCGYRGESHVKLAAGVEFMHTATLLHDDVVDESDIRRGKAAARIVWGNQATVLVGDFLLGQAFKMMVEVGSLDALDILANAAAVIAEGEVLQLGTAKSTATTEDEYMAVIAAKTAALFSAAAEVGPVLAARDRAERAAFRSFGHNFGLAFQLVDDALDYGGDPRSLGKAVGNDFREGKVTLPLILTYRRGNESVRTFLKRVVEDGNIGPGDLEQAAAYMRQHHAIEDTIDRARHFGAVARDALAPFDESGAKAALIEAVDFSISRVN